MGENSAGDIGDADVVVLLSEDDDLDIAVEVWQTSLLESKQVDIVAVDFCDFSGEERQ